MRTRGAGLSGPGLLLGRPPLPFPENQVNTGNTFSFIINPEILECVSPLSM